MPTLEEITYDAGRSALADQETLVAGIRQRTGTLLAAPSERALDIARAEGARTVELTSPPSRADANRLYERMGLTRRETNVYRFTMGVRGGA